MKCINCGANLKAKTKICPKCNTNIKEAILENPEISETVEKFGKIAKTTSLIKGLIIGVPFTLIGIVIIVLSIHSTVSDNMKSRNYAKTVGTLSRFEQDHEYYIAYYKYIVDGKSYEADYYELHSNVDDFKKEIELKYDKKNPQKVVFNSRGMVSFMFAGLFLTVLGLIIMFHFKITSFLSKRL